MPFLIQNNLRFIHIPKTAGTSITIGMGIKWQQIGHARLTHCFNPDQITMTIVRNPIDRFRSCYRFARSHNNWWHRDGREKHTDFTLCHNNTPDQIADMLLEHGDLDPSSRWHQNRSPRHQQWCGQHHWVTISGSSECKVQHVLRYENLNEEWNRFAQTYNLPYPLVHLNKVLDVEDIQLSESCISKLRHIYKKDFEMFGYSVER